MGNLLNSFKITDLDLENSDPTGLFRLDTITQYGPLVTGAPTTNGITSTNPGPARNFFQDFIPSNTYLSTYKIGGSGKIQSIFGTSRFDLSDSAPTAPYFVLTQDTVTQYGRLVTGPPVLGGLPGNGGSFPINPGPPRRFIQQFLSFNTYLDSYNRILGYSKIEKSFDLSNIESLSSYKENQDPTKYPATNTGIPTSNANPGAPSKFKGFFNPENTYLKYISEEDRDNLVSSFNKTNLDVENESPDGGIPYKQDKDPTIYPKLTTGAPLENGIPGPFTKFNQVYNPETTYLSKNPIKTVESRLSEWSVPGLNSDPKVLYRTELDNVRSSNNRNSSAFKYSTYVDSLTVAPPYRKNSNLLHLILTNNDNNQKIIKYDAYDFTRLDRESPLVGKYILEGRSGFIYDGITGGIPYKPDETDPTIYPVTSLKVGSVRGYNVVTGLGATKYTEPHDPPPSSNDQRIKFSNRKPTYLEYIKDFIQ